jgi:hypothetical protein
MARKATQTFHLIAIHRDNKMRIEKWEDTREAYDQSEQFYRDIGYYVFEGGEPQPVSSH